MDKLVFCPVLVLYSLQINFFLTLAYICLEHIRYWHSLQAVIGLIFLNFINKDNTF